MGKGRYLGSIPRQLSSGDKEFIKLISEGMKKAPAFRQAYPEHAAVIQWNNSEPGSPARIEAKDKIITAAKNKLQAKYMHGAIVSYQDSMEKFSELAVETAIELVKGARSEKVRADLAIEGMRQKVGTPVQKIAAQTQTTVVLTFGDRPEQPASQVIDAEMASEEEEHQ